MSRAFSGPPRQLPLDEDDEDSRDASDSGVSPHRHRPGPVTDAGTADGDARGHRSERREAAGHASAGREAAGHETARQHGEGAVITLDTRRAIQAEFPARADRASAVRRLVAARLEEWRLGEMAEIAVLATNELFANAVEYGSAGAGASVTVTMRCGEHELRVEVTDSSPARPTLRAAGASEESGRGIAIVDTLASAWGTELPERGGRGKKVWFTLPIRDAL